MKSKLFKIVFFFLLAAGANAQVNSNGNLTNSLSDSNYFLDASYFGEEAANIGKLLGFPQVDLTKFTFKEEVGMNLIVASYFDGVMVFNTATGFTVDNQGIKTKVSPGFYYFSNPNGLDEYSVKNGQWKTLGGMNYSSTETITNTIIGDLPVYSITGTFTVDDRDTAVKLHGADDITSLFRITIFNGDKGVYATTLYDYNPKTGDAVTGAPGMSVIYDKGTYNYVLEYFKKP